MNEAYKYVKMEEAGDPNGGEGGGAINVEPVKTEPVKTEPEKTEPAKTEPVKTEPVKTEPVKTEGALGGGDSEPEAIDWEKITDEEYIKRVSLPEGQQWNTEAMSEYAKLLRENKIDPAVFSKFVAKDAELQKARADKAKAESDKAGEEARAAFKAAGEDFRKTYSPEQVKEMNATLAKIDDPVFRTLVAKSPLSNNKTMGKMLLAYAQVYGEASLKGGGAGEGTEKTFEEVWTGKKS